MYLHIYLCASSMAFRAGKWRQLANASPRPTRTHPKGLKGLAFAPLLRDGTIFCIMPFSVCRNIVTISLHSSRFCIFTSPRERLAALMKDHRAGILPPPRATKNAFASLLHHRHKGKTPFFQRIFFSGAPLLHLVCILLRHGHARFLHFPRPSFGTGPPHFTKSTTYFRTGPIFSRFSRSHILLHF